MIFMTILHDFCDGSDGDIDSDYIGTMHILCRLKNYNKMCKIFVIVCSDETFYDWYF